MTFYPDERIALFIDGANLFSTAKTLNIDVDFKKMLELFADKGRLITANYYTAITERADFSALQPLLDWLDYNGYQVITKPAKYVTDREGVRKLKGNMDIEIAIDMLELAPHVDHILLFSGDGDFRAALKAVQKHGVRVTIVSTRKAKPPVLADELRRQSNHFIDLVDLETLINRDEDDDDDDFHAETD